jgi:hypothetical protein
LKLVNLLNSGVELCTFPETLLLQRTRRSPRRWWNDTTNSIFFCLWANASNIADCILEFLKRNNII